MISKTKGIFNNLSKPKNIHSVEYLKYLYTVLHKNQNVTEQNRDLLVEVFRLIAEILIWGDQNDSSVIDFFLEKNILALFLKFMDHKNGKLISNQLLQTLSIMFENISDNTSIYYLLSNNHINSIICHKFDFSDEEVMAYYISFLKALSMKLNKHTINFFYNEHTDDFALYTEAIKFFNQTESMVRTAVRVITLNVYKVADKPMLRYIRHKTAGPYFRSLVWSIGNHVLEIDACLKQENEQTIDSKLQSFVDEHLDNLHYINDILCLNVETLNEILIDCLLNKLIIPLYVYSLTKHRPYFPETDRRPHISHSLAMFLLAQIFVIIKQPEVIQPLANILLTGDLSCCFLTDSVSSLSSEGAKNRNVDDDNHILTDQELDKSVRYHSNEMLNERKFDLVIDSLPKLLDNVKGKPRPRSKEFKKGRIGDGCTSETEDILTPSDNQNAKEQFELKQPSNNSYQSAPVTPRLRHMSTNDSQNDSQFHNPTDHFTEFNESTLNNDDQNNFSLESKPFLKCVFRCLAIEEPDDMKSSSSSSSSSILSNGDYDTLFSLCLLFTLCQNQAVPDSLLQQVGLTSKAVDKRRFNPMLMDKFVAIFNGSVKYGSVIRLVTVELVCVLVEILVCSRDRSFITDEYFASILTAREESTLLLRNYYKSEGVFVDMFEDECLNIHKKPLNVEFLMMDSRILIAPSKTKLFESNEFQKRLPKTEVEKARYAIRVFLSLRQLCDRIKTDKDDDDDDVVNDVEDDNNVCSNIGLDDTLSNLTDDGPHRTSPKKLLESLCPYGSKIIKIGEKIDLEKRDIVACMVDRCGKPERRFLVTDEQQLMLVEPDSKKVGWGVVLFAGFLQHVKVTTVREDKRSLFVNVYDHKGAITLKTSHTSVNPILSAKFTFDDHIRCMVAQKRLEKGREQAQQTKLRQIALLLDFPTNVALQIKPNQSNNNLEYRSGYYGPSNRDNNVLSPSISRMMSATIGVLTNSNSTSASNRNSRSSRQSHNTNMTTNSTNTSVIIDRSSTNDSTNSNPSSSGPVLIINNSSNNSETDLD